MNELLVKDFKYITKHVTRKEFLDGLQASFSGASVLVRGFSCYCPNEILDVECLKNKTNREKGCRDCWLEAIKNVKFKGENLYLRVD